MATKMNRVDLTEEQRRKWIETRSALLWRCPAFTHILFSLLNPEKGELAAVFTTDVPIAATDGANLILNPEKFFGFPLDERVFIVAHEILHAILNHCSMSYQMRRAGAVKYVDGTSLPFDAKLMNYAMDLVINDTLISDRIGKFPECGCHDVNIATRADSFVDAYRKVYDAEQKGGGGGAKGSGDGSGKGSGFDMVMDPGSAQGQDPQQAAQGRSQTEWDTAVAAAIASAKLQGKLPANLERLLGEIVDPTVPWHEHVRACLARRIGGGGYDLRKPDRRLILRDIYAPRRSGNGCGVVVVGCDTSGSMQQPEINIMFAEMKAMLDDLRPEMVYVLWCDAEVHKVDMAEDAMDIDTMKPVGGGGTNFVPVFDWIDQQAFQPDALVYFTDGFGRFPDKAPPYPVIWGDTHGRVEYPFGDVVSVKLK